MAISALFSLYCMAQRFSVVAAPDAKKVVLRFYDQGEGGRAVKTVKLRHAKGSPQWAADVKGNWTGRFYTYQVQTADGQWLAETPAPDADAVGVNGRRAAVVDWESAAVRPDGWDADKPLELRSPADLVVYEMHFRDFSIDPSSGLAHKGKFLALTEERAIRHLLDLGVNAVHILPSFDYASVDESQADSRPQYNWGYDPLNYNVPEGSYSTNPYDPTCRIREFRQMVQALHKAGIRVILDVVYNHTFSIDGSAFQRTWPDAYYRRTADGQYSNGSGCGNETASEREPMRSFMLESMKHWVETYHIDGFRVDLMGVHDIETMNMIEREMKRLNPSCFIYGEGWSAGSCALPNERLGMKANTWRMPGIAAFSDDLRDALRGPFSDDTKGAFLAGFKGHEESIKFGIAGAIAHPQVDMSRVNYSKEAWATQPTQMISYVSCHDDMCLVDRLRASIPGIGDDELIRLDLLAQTAVFTSQGVPFMLAGEEMLRTKQGVHNSYNSPDAVNHLDWGNLQRFPQVFDYYKGLTQLRRNHKAFRLGDADLVREHLDFLAAPDGVVAYQLKNLGSFESFDHIVVVLNSQKTAQRVAIPAGDYRAVCANGRIDERGLGNVSGTAVEVAPQSALILFSN